MRTIENSEVVELILETRDMVLSHIESKRKTMENPIKKTKKTREK